MHWVWPRQTKYAMAWVLCLAELQTRNHSSQKERKRFPTPIHHDLLQTVNNVEPRYIYFFLRRFLRNILSLGLCQTEHPMDRGNVPGWCHQSSTHLDFVGDQTVWAVHPLKGDGVELALVEVNHGQLGRLVLDGLRGSQNELESVPGDRKEQRRMLVHSIMLCYWNFTPPPHCFIIYTKLNYIHYL